MFTTTPYVMFSGFFLYYRDTPKVFQWMYETSVVRHAIEAVSIAIFGYGRKPLYCDVVIIFFTLFYFHRDLRDSSSIQYTSYRNILKRFSQTLHQSPLILHEPSQLEDLNIETVDAVTHHGVTDISNGFKVTRTLKP